MITILDLDPSSVWTIEKFTDNDNIQVSKNELELHIYCDDNLSKPYPGTLEYLATRVESKRITNKSAIPCLFGPCENHFDQITTQLVECMFLLPILPIPRLPWSSFNLSVYISLVFNLLSSLFLCTCLNTNQIRFYFFELC